MVVTKHDAAVAAARSQEAAAESSQEAAEVQQTQPRKEDQQDAKPVQPHSGGTRFSSEGEASSCGSS